ncbi:diguanylate cyclase [Sulfurimonas sp.]|uniref:diguanylate cyclase domain-containing protein n=1 Tax=Sulfurimonas sp. TaxID=2022749 RepID=UPI0025D6CA45|nr:diguanylate cyclase [Sulfurimonas sp.]MDD5156899.1 diguanylate cyclase [Sulfurimonas sp.]
MLWRIYKSLQMVLGASLNELYTTINAIGSGDFYSPIIIPSNKKSSIFGWLYETQQQLSKLETNRQKSENEANRLTQLYIALSRCDQAIVYSTNENELFKVICQDAVEFGGMLMAWIGMYDEKKQELKPTFYAGSGTEYLKNLHISTSANSPTSHGPTGIVFREDRPYWCQDFQNDSATALWHQKREQFGWRASAALPLHRDGLVIGVFTLYASEVNAFDEMAQKLLIKMATDIDFALKNFDREAANKKAEISLNIQAQAMEQSSNIIIITDFKGNISYVNSAFVKATGYTAEEAIEKNPRFLKSGKTPLNAHDDMWFSITRGLSWQGEFTNKRKDGTEYTYFISVSPVVDTNGRTTHYIAIEEDITQQKQTTEKIHYLANYDLLTGLPNRAQLNDRFQYVLNLAKHNDQSFSIMFIDLDHFKEINDTLGHSIGDALLVEIARRFGLLLREEDTIARLGGDEFVLLFPDTDAKTSLLIAQKLLKITAESFLVNEYEIIVTASIGIALYPSDGLDIETLSKNADAAMYRAKQEGRNNYCFFTQEMQKRSTRTLVLSNALHHALEKNELYLVYQPQISLKNGNIIGAEVLLRWENPQLGIISPAEFIPIAEENGLIISIGEWVLRTAIAQTKIWVDNGLAIVVAVNISSIQFRQPNLSRIVTAMLKKTA